MTPGSFPLRVMWSTFRVEGYKRKGIVSTSNIQVPINRQVFRAPFLFGHASENRCREVHADISNDRKMRTFLLHYDNVTTFSLTSALVCLTIRFL